MGITAQTRLSIVSMHEQVINTFAETDDTAKAAIAATVKPTCTWYSANDEIHAKLGSPCWPFYITNWPLVITNSMQHDTLEKIVLLGGHGRGFWGEGGCEV